MLSYDQKSLGDYLKEVRLKANLTQAEVAKRLGYKSAQFVSNLERGSSVAPLATLAKFAKICKCPTAKIETIIIDGHSKHVRKVLRGR